LQVICMKKRNKIMKDSNVPLYQQVSAMLARDIKSGRFKPDTPLPSINCIEAELGVARNTVIQAMRQLVQDGFAVAKHGKGFYAVDQKQQPVLNMVLPLHHYYYIQVYVNLIAGAQEMADQNGERLQIYNSSETHAGFVSALREISSSRPDARIIAVPPCNGNGIVLDKSSKELEKISKGGAKVIVVDRKLRSTGIPQITQDRLEGRKLLLSRLFTKASRKAVFFNASEHARELKRFANEQSWKGSLAFESTSGLSDDLALLKENRYVSPNCSNDLHARRLINAAGGKVDFMLAGYDGTVNATSGSPRISTVNSNLMQAGELAYSLMNPVKPPEYSRTCVKPFFVQGETF